MAHKCKALLITCIDFRFVEAIHKFALEQGLKDSYDLVSIAGAGLNLTKGRGILNRIKRWISKWFVLLQIAISSRLHGIEDVFVINHEDCGAYGGKRAFDSNEKEFEKHKEDLKEVKGLISRKFPNLRVWKVFARIKEEVNEKKIWFERWE